MSAFNQRIREIKAVFWCIQGFNMMLELLIFFLAFSIAFQMMGSNMWYAIIPGTLSFLLLVFYRVRTRDVIGYADARCLELKNRLKTAYDNRGQANIIVDDLKSGVSRDIGAAESSSFIETAQIAKRVFMIIVLAFILLTITFIDLRNLSNQLFDNKLMSGVKELKNGYSELLSANSGSEWESSDEIYKVKNMEKLGAEPGGEKPGYSWGPIPGTGGGTGTDTNEDIFGKPSAANLGSEEIGFELHPEYGGDIEIKRTEDTSKQGDFSMEDVRSAETCEECMIGPEYEEIVRRYFEKLVGE